MSALFAAVERRDLALLRLLLDAGATSDEDAFYHACEQSDTALLDALHRPGFENLVNHKLDFEDLTGLRWFLDHGVDVNAHRCLHHAISRGRGVPILTALIDAGADVNLPWDRWDVGRRPLALAARCGHLAAFELLASRGASRRARPGGRRGARGRARRVSPPAEGPGAGAGQPGRRRVRLDPRPVRPPWPHRGGAGAARQRPTRGHPRLEQLHPARPGRHARPHPDRAATHRPGRRPARLRIRRGGPTPLDCAIWGIRNNHAEDGDYPGTVRALLAAGAPTRYQPPTGDPAVDTLLINGLA